MTEAAELPDNNMQAIAITGLACRFPGAESAEEFWESCAGASTPARRCLNRNCAGRAWALSDPAYVAMRKRFSDPALFDAEYFGLSPAEASVTDPQQRFLLETAVHALEDAGLVPASFPGRVGVYLGVNISDYLLQNILPNPEAIKPLGFHRVLMGNDRGYTATQLSYRLGLTGPSLAVDCACSSSLAAVHHACRALMDYEADAVLVGGAAINPTDVGYAPVEGGISSPDGRCRPFSADARGTVFSSGAGLVVLRRLDEALEDGDRVLAVIRASGLNNDGARKSGYTAPSIRGQAELIAEVHERAGAPDQISYVEAHATGTPLGDPIEVSALTEAFRRTGDTVGHCGIGSVKSNIGHLDAASGIAGLIKVVLSLRHRQLPATLGCDSNPHIDFHTSPFRVNTRLRPWTGQRPLLAGVSSLGVGGTLTICWSRRPRTRRTGPPRARPPPRAGTSCSSRPGRPPRWTPWRTRYGPASQRAHRATPATWRTHWPPVGRSTRCAAPCSGARTVNRCCSPPGSRAPPQPRRQPCSPSPTMSCRRRPWPPCEACQPSEWRYGGSPRGAPPRRRGRTPTRWTGCGGRTPGPRPW